MKSISVNVKWGNVKMTVIQKLRYTSPLCRKLIVEDSLLCQIQSGFINCMERDLLSAVKNIKSLSFKAHKLEEA